MAIAFGHLLRPVGLGLAVALGVSLSLGVTTAQATADGAATGSQEPRLSRSG